MRVIVLAPTVIELFKAQQMKQALMMLDTGKKWENNNLIFTNPTGSYISYRTVYDCFKRGMVKLGLPDTCFHDLRHAYAEAAIKSGDDIRFGPRHCCLYAGCVWTRYKPEEAGQHEQNGTFY